MSRPKVLVLLAAFNGSKWILDQVESILDQINVDVDLIISDDGSTDGTDNVIARFLVDRRVQVVSPPVPTGSAAQNFLWLIRRTSADEYDFVAFSDQDDIWDEDRILRGCRALRGSGAIGYSSAVTAFWSDGRVRKLEQVRTLTASDFMFEGAGQGCTYVLARSFYTRLREFLIQHVSETQFLHYHDWAIYALSRSWNLKWSFDPKSSLRYRQHARNDTGARASIDGLRRRLSLIKNGWYSKQLRTIAGICAEASPEDPSIAEWHEILLLPRSLARSWRIARYCMRGGRRRLPDKAILLGAVVVGWI